MFASAAETSATGTTVTSRRSSYCTMQGKCFVTSNQQQYHICQITSNKLNCRLEREEEESEKELGKKKAEKERKKEKERGELEVPPETTNSG